MIDDAPQTGAAQGRTPQLRPRDSASLILFDCSGGRTRILMGRRAEGHVFMPGHLVFPGGRLDPADLALAKQFALHPDARQRLTVGTSTRFSPHRATALALAAIRETFEETGVMIGSPALFEADAPFWRDFSRAGVRPTPQHLVPIARAITPPGQRRRFDTRFFLAPAPLLAVTRDLRDRPTDEFDEVLWVDAAELGEHRLAEITRIVLGVALDRLQCGDHENAARPMPFYRRMGRGRHIDLL